MPTVQGVKSTIGPGSVASKVFDSCLTSSAEERQQATADCLYYHRRLLQDTGNQSWKLEKSEFDEICKSCTKVIPAGTDRFENVLTYKPDGTECMGSWHTNCLGIVHFTAHAQGPRAIQTYGAGCTCISDPIGASETAPLTFTIGGTTRLFSDTDRK